MSASSESPRKPSTAAAAAFHDAARAAPTCGSVGVVVTETTPTIIGDAFISPLMRGIYTALAERSILPVMLAPHSSNDMAMVEEYLVGKHVDGAILVSLHHGNQLPRHLADRGVPTVICGRPPKGLEAGYVDSDNRQGGAMAVNHLIALGRRRIAMIAGNLDMPGAVDRLNGYRDALADAGIPLDPTLEEVVDYQPERVQMAMERLLLNHPDVDAVFAASDPIATAAMQVLLQARKRIPEDIAIIGFDDSPSCLATRPPLSSIRQPFEAMSREAVNTLMRTIAEPGEAPRQVTLATELVVRESTVGAGHNQAQS